MGVTWAYFQELIHDDVAEVNLDWMYELMGKGIILWHTLSCSVKRYNTVAYHVLFSIDKYLFVFLL